MLFPQIGLLGLILEPLLTYKKNDTMRETKKLPLSFITKYIKHSYGNDIKNIKFAIFWKPRTIEIHTLDDQGIYFLVDKNKYNIIKSWIDKHDIQFNIGKGLIEKLIGKFKKKD